MSTVTAIRGITLVPGQAQGAAFVLREPLSFWGGLDPVSGRIIDRWHPQSGDVISGRVLVMEAGRGSSSGSSVLAEALRRGTGPCGIVLGTRDAIVTVGAMVAAELYGTGCPVVLVEAEEWPRLTIAPHITVEADQEGADILAHG